MVTPSPRLPFFVYGTLRNGQDNYPARLQGRTTREQVGTVNGYRMVGFTDGGFPYALDGSPDDTITGDVMWVDEAHYDQVLSDMDNLEGYNPNRENRKRNLYNRENVTVLVDGSTVDAWMYVSTYELEYLLGRGLILIPSGDWVASQVE